MELTDEEIVKKCLKKDATAQKQLYDKYSPILFGLCIRYSRCREDAEDIFQEAFVKVYEQLPKYSFRGSLAGWLRRLFVNCALNYYRYDKSHFFVDQTEYELVPNTPVQIDKISTEELLTQIKELPEECRLVFNLIEIEGYSYSELAEMWQANQVTLRGLNFKAKKILKAKLEKLNIKP